MDSSHQFLDKPNQVRNPFSSKTRHGCSTAQMCLAKILHIITSVTPHDLPNHELEGLEKRGLYCGDNGGFGVDLKMKFATPNGTVEFDPLVDDGELRSSGDAVGEVVSDVIDCVVEKIDLPAMSVIVKSSEGECALDEKVLDGNYSHEIKDDENEEKIALVEGQMKMDSAEPKNSQMGNKEESEKGTHPRERYGSEGCLGLLIEAAKLLSADLMPNESDSEQESVNLNLVRLRQGEETAGAAGFETTNKQCCAGTGKRSNRNKCWVAANMGMYGHTGDPSPVVRSKRGRSQVLPYKYRDSVLEPLTRLSRHKSNTVPTKRRSR